MTKQKIAPLLAGLVFTVFAGLLYGLLHGNLGGDTGPVPPLVEARAAEALLRVQNGDDAEAKAVADIEQRHKFPKARARGWSDSH